MQFLLGLLAGLLASAFGAYLQYYLAERAESRKRNREDFNLIYSFKEEIISNTEMLSANCVELENELEYICI